MSIRHIEERYGRDEARTRFFEIWNEPNLSGFWEGADKKAYFELYDLTAKTIKSIDPALNSNDVVLIKLRRSPGIN
jgi:xylan 1,4-beta-xylosidase